MSTTWTAWVAQYGYLAVFLGTFLEGESTLVAGALAAHAGYLDVMGVLAAGLSGSFFADQFFFRLGRLLGRPWLAKRPLWQARAERVYRLLEHYDAAFILGFRFLYGLRSVAPFVVGASDIRQGRFILFNFLGALLWTLLIGCGGFFLADVWEALPPGPARWAYVAAAVAAVLTLLTGVSYMRRRRREARALSRASAAPAAGADLRQTPCD